MRVKYIVTESQFKNILKRFTGSNKSKPVERVENEIKIKNEIENLEGKTVTFEEFQEDTEEVDTNVYRITNPRYEVIDTGKQLRGLIRFDGVNLQLPISSNYSARNMMVDLIDGQVRVYSFYFDSGGGDLIKTIYRNEKLEKYLESLNEKFPIFWKDKDPLQTDF